MAVTMNSSAAAAKLALMGAAIFVFAVPWQFTGGADPSPLLVDWL